jgi:hypothetical protein
MLSMKFIPTNLGEILIKRMEDKFIPYISCRYYFYSFYIQEKLKILLYFSSSLSAAATVIPPDS